ncbi:MAG TPA: hypothetical protein VIK28_09870 [Sedimentisphaerales bacterium]
MKDKLLSKDQRIAAAQFLRIVRMALSKENIKGIRYAVTQKRGEIVLRLYGSGVDRFLAEAAIHKHTSPRPIQTPRNS